MAGLAIIAISEDGIEVANRISSSMVEDGPEVWRLKDGVWQTNSRLSTHDPALLTLPLKDLVVRIFSEYRGIIFIMAIGIVVRLIAPHIKDKHSDPAVVAVDDVGRYVISVLSGHEGGANELAQRVANILRTDAVITTGTEARKNLIIGIGCARNTASGKIMQAIKTALDNAHIPLARVRLLATIDLKADEKGLHDASKELGIPLRIIPKQEIETCAKAYNESDFVQNKIGVGGVCEPAALLAGRKTRLILPKQHLQGVTVAVAQENFMW